MEINKIYNGDCISLFNNVEDNFVDLIVTSPPYNVGINYDSYDDSLTMEEYKEWCRKWLTEVYRTLKPDGRVAINILREINAQDRGGRVFLVSEFWQVMKEVGFQWFGIVDLEEDSPHRPKNTAWGSWMSPSSPYIYNPKECVILAYKEDKKKKTKGVPNWKWEDVEVEKDGKIKNKKVYSDEDKKEFMELVFSQWKYQNDSNSLTKATFSLDIPLKAMKILTYEGDIVLDCFSGSGTTALAAKMLGRNYIGFELSKTYYDTSIKRLNEYDEKINGQD